MVVVFGSGGAFGFVAVYVRVLGLPIRRAVYGDIGVVCDFAGAI